jgi:hypothetical protein
MNQNYSLSIEEKTDYLHAHVKGVRTRDAVIAITMEIFEKALSKGLFKVLIDVTKLEGRLSIADSHHLVTEVFAEIRGKGISKAVIVDENAPALRKWFLETAARNRGFNFKIFNNSKDALDWLLK